MTELGEYTLGPQALQFLKENRRTYGLTFSKQLLALLDLDAGKITTRLPLDVTAQQLYDFEGGGVLPFPDKSKWFYVKQPDGRENVVTPVPRDDTVVIESIGRFLRKGPKQLCLMEKPLATSSDIQKYGSKVPCVLFNQEVYYLMFGPGEEQSLREALKWAHTAFTFLAALTSLPEDHKGLRGWSEATPDAVPDVTAEDLKTLAERTEKIIIGAYDGEGYLIWHKPET